MLVPPSQNGVDEVLPVSGLRDAVASHQLLRVGESGSGRAV